MIGTEPFNKGSQPANSIIAMAPARIASLGDLLGPSNV
jgi:hypothetical protein